MFNGSFSVRSTAPMEFLDITREVNAAVAQCSVDQGLLFLFNPHTTAGLTINEGADPTVAVDILDGLSQFVPMNYPFRHLEGNSPAHIMASLIGTSVTVAIRNQTVQLGTWQKLFFCEFDGPRTRTVHYHIISG
ncbi:secondary thiamine-phosphate synthase enzyme YjbQ [Desulfofustis limnaeus]|jgi:secondary thiamine-phosphate synthase enzyme|uniref:YjbQ family protein n=1 Tax=Desulfofustis limnaeus TaxID=2740163 RepID=A0ABM7W4I4_9BACT|nr:secondary thiamine-phosphate synthase enzyme YjbQ [Desulfofustis limnaeus]MDX9893826.1 secondary thiamine-phosphate synthase enzyme YjbQ [Desulfofustis sp.]BDD85776.1 hypothetical protein DPPLL_01410 [Desulfofustis limnaeus]